MNENKNIDPKLAEALKGIWDSLTDEQREKAKACKSMDELTALAGKEGIELPDEVLDAVAGGYIVYFQSPSGSETWKVVSDDYRKDVGNFGNLHRAEIEARYRGFSTKVISEKEYFWKQPFC